MMKKIPVILAACMLLFSALAAAEESGEGPAQCCFSYHTTRVPKNNVVTFQRTHTHCAKDAVVFTMKRDGIKLCVDRTQDWVQETISHVEARAAA